MPPVKTLSQIVLSMILSASLAAAPYRLNRVTDSALSLYVDNAVSAAADTEGNLHLVYTDSASGSRVWQIYYRSLKDGYWAIPTNLTASISGIVDNRSPQIVFDAQTRSLYALWLGLSGEQTVRTYKLFVEKIDPETGEHSSAGRFDFGLGSFQPRVVSTTGRVLILSEERPSRNSTFFRVRVLDTVSGQWSERVLQNSKTERIASPILAGAGDRAILFWVRSAAEGVDLMASRLAPGATKWDDARSLLRVSAFPEALSADMHHDFVSLAWTVRGGGKNSIIMQTASVDGGGTWATPQVLFSVDTGASAVVRVVSDTEAVALLLVSAEGGDRIEMKYTQDRGEKWIPDNEVEALNIGPEKTSSKAQRPILVFGPSNKILLAWEEWKGDGPTLAFKSGSVSTLGRSAVQYLFKPKDLPADRFPYFPQLWQAGKTTYVTWGSKRRLQTVTGRTSTNDIFVMQMPSAPSSAPRPQPAKKQQTPRAR